MKITDSYHQKIGKFFSALQKFADRIWYAPLIGLLAAMDYFIIIFPTDGILISSSMLLPKRWYWFAIFIATGSTLGALVFAALVQLQGLPWILELYPNLQQGHTWIWTAEFFENYGLWVVFIIAASPIIQQPMIIVACMANTKLLPLGLVIFAGRATKAFILAFIGSHAPRLLGKMWGIRGDLKELNIKPDL